ncbi:MAG TPA: Gfo/Idh/MocA family oxidoreductase [Phototrophicaceae bacterium]|nr:Gfo/Idh/MocA family oxidoreductase [Phototrophicaceae bacterium]
METSATRIAMIGCGGMARTHMQHMLKSPQKNQFVVVSEPSEQSYAALDKLFSAAGVPTPPNQPDLARMLDEYAGKLDAAFIVTPHIYHFDQAQRCLDAGLDVLLEKPMVMNQQEAIDLIAARDRSKRHLVVAFNGSLSPRIRAASAMLRSGEIGKIQSISAAVWQNWGTATHGLWRQDPVIAGGGFMFDTGAHMLNTVCDLAGEDFVEVSAWLDNLARPVDIIGVVIGRLASGALVTMHACGETIHTWDSDVKIFGTQAIIRTDVWGKFLELQRDGERVFTPIEFVDPPTVWEQFLSMRAGEMENVSPPEVGLRMAKLWDAIQESARNQGRSVMV